MSPFLFIFCSHSDMSNPIDGLRGISDIMNRFLECRARRTAFILFAAVALTGTLISPATVADDALEARVKSLEGEVQALRVLIGDLRAELDELRQLQEMSMPIAPQSCTQRLEAMRAKRDALTTLGLAERHPDVIHVSRKVTDLEQECATEQAAQP